MNNQTSSKLFKATKITFGGEHQNIERIVPVEAPLQIIYGEIPYAVMMITPDDMEDFITGFSCTEGVIAQKSDIRDLKITHDKDSIKAHINLTPHKISKHLARKRLMSGRTSCGVCGIDDPAALKTVLHPVAPNEPIAIEAIQRALLELEQHQPLNDATRAVHVAAWFQTDGAFIAAREDVGRHNALDKLIGALMNQNISSQRGFIVISSRCSFEMVEKAACFGASTLVAISAPTSLALQHAQDLGVTILAVARRDGVLLF